MQHMTERGPSLRAWVPSSRRSRRTGSGSRWARSARPRAAATACAAGSRSSTRGHPAVGHDPAFAFSRRDSPPVRPAALTVPLVARRGVGNAVAKLHQTRKHGVSSTTGPQAEGRRCPGREVDRGIARRRPAPGPRRGASGVEPATLAIFEHLLAGREVADVARASGMTEAAVHRITQRIRVRLVSLRGAICDEDGDSSDPG